MTFPTATDVAQQAEYEVDEVLADAPPDLFEHMSVATRRLVREVMILSWQRGAAFIVEKIKNEMR